MVLFVNVWHRCYAFKIVTNVFPIGTSILFYLLVFGVGVTLLKLYSL